MPLDGRSPRPPGPTIFGSFDQLSNTIAPLPFMLLISRIIRIPNYLRQIDTSDFGQRSVACFHPGKLVISFQLIEPSFVAIGATHLLSAASAGTGRCAYLSAPNPKIVYSWPSRWANLSQCHRYRHSSFTFQSSIHYPFAEVDTHSILLMLWTERTSDE